MFTKHIFKHCLVIKAEKLCYDDLTKLKLLTSFKDKHGDHCIGGHILQI